MGVAFQWHTLTESIKKENKRKRERKKEKEQTEDKNKTMGVTEKNWKWKGKIVDILILSMKVLPNKFCSLRPKLQDSANQALALIYRGRMGG